MLVVHKQRLVLPSLIDLGRDEFAFAVFIFVVQRIVLELQDFAGQGLTERQDGAAAELGEINGFAHFLADFVIGIDFAGCRQGDFLVRVSHIVIGNDFAVAIDFKVALVRVNNHVEVFVRTKDFGNHAAKAFFEHTDHCGAVYILRLLELGEGVNETQCLLFFLCHILFLFSQDLKQAFIPSLKNLSKCHAADAVHNMCLLKKRNNFWIFCDTPPQPRLQRIRNELKAP